MRACLILVIGLAGCGFGPELPEDTSIQCSSNDDCPEGWICMLSVGRCAEDNRTDTTPPALTHPATLSPSTAVAGETVTLTFTVDEPLSLAPQVSLTAGGSAYPFIPGPVDDETYVYTLGITAAMPVGTWVVSARLVDEAGNSATRTLAHLTIE